MQPTLDEVIPRRITHPKRQKSHGLSPIYAVHRIDRDTSGLLVFARSEEAQVALIDQFARHTASRVYHTIIQGTLPAQTIRSRLIRNRGDGLRGSTTRTDKGYEAVTHIQPLRPLGAGHSELECRLETGRTHQIRIHLAELGHPVCGDIIYRGPFEGPMIDDSIAPRRLALHATQLGFTHPATRNELDFQSVWPTDIQRFITRLLEH
jgi:23S rRNA pseudouridine1911/1915/1917 synthase